MKMAKILAMVLALALIAAGAVLPVSALKYKGENLVANGSFEDGLTGWKICKGAGGEPALNATATGEIVTDIKAEGSSAVHLKVGDERLILRQFFPVGTLTVGKEYQVSLCLNIVSGTGVRIALRSGDKYNGDPTYCDLINSASPYASTGVTNGWKRISRAFTYDSDAAGCSLIVDCSVAGAAELYVDNVQICETDTGLLADDGEFEYFTTDFSTLEASALNTWFNRTTGAFAGDQSLVQTEDYGSAVKFTGRASASNYVNFRFDTEKLAALSPDATIKVSFRAKVEKTSPADYTLGVLRHKAATGGFGIAFTIPSAYCGRWVTVEHWYALRDVSDKTLTIRPGTMGVGTDLLIDSVSAYADDVPAVALDNTIFISEAKREGNTINDGYNDGEGKCYPAYTTMRVSVPEENYHLGDTVTTYAHYPTMSTTEQSGIIISAVYKTTDGARSLERITTKPITAIKGGDCGEQLELPLTGLTLSADSTYTVESFLWSGLSGLRPLSGASKGIHPLVAA